MSTLTWASEYAPLSTLRTWDANPRSISGEQAKDLEQSLERFDLADPLIVDHDFTVIGGCQRFNALLRLHGPEYLAAIRRPSRKLTAEEFRELNVRLNRHNGEWDWDRLSELFSAGELVELGFTLKELDAHGISELIEDDDTEVVDVDPRMAEAAELRRKWGTEPGQLWLLGRHRLLCGDATNGEDVSRLLGSHVPALMVTDPPYGVNYDPAWRGEALDQNVNRPSAVLNDDRADWREAWELFPGTTAYEWHAGLFGSVVQQSLESVGFNVRSQIIWAKNRFALSRGNYHWQHEPCWYAVRQGCSSGFVGGRDQSTLWEISASNQDADTVHSTQKPLECMERPIRNSSNPGDWVYDPFVGSGTTIIAAERSKRRCMGLELSPEHVAVCLQLFEDATGVTPTLEAE